MVNADEKESLKQIKKEVLSYLASKGLSISLYSHTYHVEKSEKNNKQITEEKFSESLFNYKLRLYFSSEFFNSQHEYNNLFAHLYNNTTINKDHLLNNMNDLTDGYWKKDINSFVNLITENNEQKKELILNINNSQLGLNTKNLQQVNTVFKNLENNEKIDFWVKFFTKRKKALNNNKGGSEVQKFLTELFTREQIKNNFLNLSPYINELFEHTTEVDIFNKVEDYQKVLSFNCKNIEKALKVAKLNSKKLEFELPKTMNWLSSIMGYKSQVVEAKNGKDLQLILSSNEPIDDNKFKQHINDYMILVKNNEGKFYEKEEDFGKWYMKNKLERKLVDKENTTKSKTLKI